MKNVENSLVYGCALSLVLLGIVGCAIDEYDPDSTSDEVVDQFDPERAAAIAKAKMASTGVEQVDLSTEFAPCGTVGPTSISERVNDAAFTGAANQRSGSSTSCIALGALQPTDDALYYCYTNASDGTWTYNKNLRTGVRGWTRDDLLRPPPGASVGGARNKCPF